MVFSTNKSWIVRRILENNQKALGCPHEMFWSYPHIQIARNIPPELLKGKYIFSYKNPPLATQESKFMMVDYLPE